MIETPAEHKRRLQRTAMFLMRPIPTPPPPPPPKPQDSWAGLKVGMLKRYIIDPERSILDRDEYAFLIKVYQVTAADSQGVWLEDAAGTRHRWEDKEWKTKLETVKRSRKKATSSPPTK